jgi:uncharacterized membrane protein YeaQ/YmgE (transglycosylase-associated protein family)
MGLIAWIVIGLVVGGFANWIVRGGFGLIGSLVGGVIGAVIAGYISNLATGETDGFTLTPLNFIFALFFAILVVGGTKYITGRGSDA